MRWDDFRRSDNVEDRRGQGGGNFGGMPLRVGHLGIGSIILILIFSWVTGINPLALLGGLDTGPVEQAPSAETRSSDAALPDETSQFVAAVLGETEDRWSEVFRSRGQTYDPPRLVLFSGITRSACGTAQSAMGPFYCPNDQRVYLDTDFFREIETHLKGCRAGSKACQFSQAYVIAHEVGHHVQNLLGTLREGRQGAGATGTQVRVELQADCYAGVWANRSEQKWQFLEPGDVEAALQTASAIGDDILQRRSQGYVVPDSFTHGTSAQRVRWFSRGLKSGDIDSCNTFAAGTL
jgi:predicted metalloprotease